MQTECSSDLFGFAPVEGRRVEAAVDGGTITSDAGALLLGATDRAIRLVERFASCFRDARCPELIEHQVAALRPPPTPEEIDIADPTAPPPAVTASVCPICGRLRNAPSTQLRRTCLRNAG